MKKVCFVTLGNLYTTPYIKTYIDNFSEDIIYDIIYWDRGNIAEDMSARKIFRFEYSIESNRDSNKINFNILSKVKGYFEFSRYASDILENYDYDYVILLQTYAAIVNRKVLLNKYKRKYILDIRDYTLENNKIYYYIEKQLIRNSFQTVISSEGYKSFLPDYNYIISHNNHNYERDIFKINNEKLKDDVINISFIGLFGYMKQHEKLLLNFKNHPNIKLSFIGQGSNKLLEFIENNNIKNVKIIDRFNPEETYDHYSKASFINNLYGNNTPVLDYALSNKLYYAAELKIPILVCPNTYMAKITNEYGLGIVIDDLKDEKLGENLLTYYQNIDWKEFRDNCNRFMSKVHQENEDFFNFINNL